MQFWTRTWLGTESFADEPPLLPTTRHRPELGVHIRLRTRPPILHTMARGGGLLYGWHRPEKNQAKQNISLSYTRVPPPSYNSRKGPGKLELNYILASVSVCATPDPIACSKAAEFEYQACATQALQIPSLRFSTDSYKFNYSPLHLGSASSSLSSFDSFDRNWPAGGGGCAD